MRKITHLLLSMLAIAGYVYPSNLAKCEHFWVHDNSLVPSGKVTGIDVGTSPFQKENKGRGVYQCQLYLSQEDLINDRFVFIGEVGDSSYLEVSQINEKTIHNPPVTHGLIPRSIVKPDTGVSLAKYMTFLPFIVRVSSIFREEGLYRFLIVYEDLSPGRTGIRSGPIETLSFGGVIKRIAFGFPSLSLHAFQLALLIPCLFISFFLVGLSSRIGFWSCALTFSSILTVLQCWGVIRYFIPLRWSFWLHYNILLWNFAIYQATLSILIKRVERARKLYLDKNLKRITLGLVSALPLVSLFVDLNNLWVAITLYTLPYVWVGAVLNLFHISRLNKKESFFIDSVQPSTKRAAWLLILSLVWLFDLFNWCVLDFKFPFFVSHYVYFSSLVFLTLFTNIRLKVLSAQFESNLRGLRGRTIQRLSDQNEAVTEIMSWLASELGTLFGSSRVSIIEIQEKTFKFLGLYGAYSSSDGNQSIVDDSFLSKLIRDKQIIKGTGQSSFSTSIHTDWHLVPLISQSRVVGAICLTDYQLGWMFPFYETRLILIREELEPCINLLFSHRETKIKESLVQIEREKSHPLLIDSEEFLFRNFVVDEDQSAYGFLMGDLCESVALRESYGSNSVNQSIEHCLEAVWDISKDLGIVIDFREGDSFSITVPKLRNKSIESHINRAFEVALRWEELANTKFSRIAKDSGVFSALLYRLIVSSAITKQPHPRKRFDYLPASEKDTASRVLREICLPGELIIIGNEFVTPEIEEYLLEMEPRRLRGKKFSTQLFLLRKRIGISKTG